MTGSFVVSGENTTVRFEYTAQTVKIQEVISDSAERLFDRGFGDHGTEEEPRLFSDQSNQEKLDLVDAYVKKVIVNMANDQRLSAAREAVVIVEHEI